MTTLARATVLVGIGGLLWFGFELLLLLFAGALLAIFLRTLAVAVARPTGLKPAHALGVVLIALVGAAVLFGWLYAPRLAEQVDELSTTLPRAFDDLTGRLREYSWGRWLLEQSESAASGEEVAGRAATAVNRVMHLGVAVVVVLFTGLYLAVDPAGYLRGALRLFPAAYRRRAAETLFAVGHVLRWWLLGQGIAMAAVGLAMGIGFALIGVRLSLILGVLAGLFEFVPVLGPLIALGPALLLALAESPQQAGWVLLLYSIVQTGESYALTPLVQRKAVELPPVVTIAAQVGLSWAAGPIGLLVAVPLTAAIMVAVQMLYVNGWLRDRVAPEIEAMARSDVEKARGGALAGLLPA